MLSARNISNRQIDFDAEHRLIDEGSFELENARTRIATGDVLLTTVGTIGRVAVVPVGAKKFALQRSVSVLKPRPCIRSTYLAYVLESPDIQKQLTENAKGTAQKGIYLNVLGSLEMPLAPINEQKRIADKLDAVLTRVDACRDRLDRVPAILKRFRQSVLAAATSGKLTEEWREENETLIWRDSRIGDIYQLIDGDRGPNYPKQKDYSSDGHCLFLSTKNVRPFGFLFDEMTFISKVKHEQLRNGTLQVLDVVVTTRGTLGNVAIYDNKTAVGHPIVRINSGMLIVREKVVGSILPEYLKLFIASPSFSNQLEEKQTGSAQPQIPAGILKTFTISIPEIPEQTEIVRRIESLFAYADRLEARYASARAQTERLTPSLLAKAFRGELVPQDPNDEPASVLLERIRFERNSQPAKVSRGRKGAA